VFFTLIKMSLRRSRMRIAVFAVLSVIAAGSEQGDQEVNVDPNTQLLLMGTRHGNRNPGKFLPGDKNAGKWGLEGDSMLTTIGKRMTYAAGQMFRNRYGKLIPEQFNTSEVSAYSSSADRCQMTLQTTLAGAFPPVADSYAEWGPLNWQPMSYTVNNQMLRMYAVDDCPAQIVAWQRISDDNLPALAKELVEKKDIADYVSQQTGWNGSLSNLADVADNLISLKAQNLEMPDWVEKSTMVGKEGESIFDDILEFAESHQIACALDKPCAYMMAGLWLKHMGDQIRATMDGESATRFVGYASHTEITMSAMRLMHQDVHHMPTSGGFVIEYRNTGGVGMVRVLYHSPDEANPDVHHIELIPQIHDDKLFEEWGEPCNRDSEGWCEAFEFLESIKGNSFKRDWQDECGTPRPKCSPETRRGGIEMDVPCKYAVDRHSHCDDWLAANSNLCKSTAAKLLFCYKTCNCKANQDTTLLLLRGL
jgi:hypothetical protein